MKRSVALLLSSIVCGATWIVTAGDLEQVQSVYLLPMSGGLDQYLANRLSASGVFQVVTDPKKADAIFTDSLGEAFERRLDELLAPAPAAEDKSNTLEQSDRRVVISTFGKGKGNVFLVEAASRKVVWSTYELPKNTTPRELDRTAQRLVERLKIPPQKK